MIVYLASPYSHADPEVRARRYIAACKAAAQLMEAGEVVYSPIAHSHPLSGMMRRQHPHEFWMRQAETILRHCARLDVLLLEGWEKSVGVTAEIHLAHRLRLPVGYVAEPVEPS